MTVALATVDTFWIRPCVLGNEVSVTNMIIEQKLGISENTDAIKMNLNALWSQLEFETNQSNISERRTENLIRKLHERDGERYSVDSNKYCSFEQSAKSQFYRISSKVIFMCESTDSFCLFRFLAVWPGFFSAWQFIFAIVSALY